MCKTVKYEIQHALYVENLWALAYRMKKKNCISGKKETSGGVQNI